MVFRWWSILLFSWNSPAMWSSLQMLHPQRKPELSWSGLGSGTFPRRQKYLFQQIWQLLLIIQLIYSWFTLWSLHLLWNHIQSNIIWHLLFYCPVSIFLSDTLISTFMVKYTDELLSELHGFNTCNIVKSCNRLHFVYWLVEREMFETL